MPRSHGRIIVSPTAPVELLAMLPLASALRQTTSSPRGHGGGGSPRSASASPSPQQRPKRLPGGLLTEPDGRHSSRREAWGGGGSVPASPAHGQERRDCGSARGDGAHKPKREGSCPQQDAPLMRSVDWNNATLFGGEKNTNPKAKRCAATTFRRPSSSRAVPHQRPIFVNGPDGTDARICVDMQAPLRFGSADRTRYELSWCGEGSRKAESGGRPPIPARATMKNIGNLGGTFGSGRDGSAQGCHSGRASAPGYRSGSPMRPESVTSGLLAALQTLPTRNPALCRPVSTTPDRRGWSPAAPACWSGA